MRKQSFHYLKKLVLASGFAFGSFFFLSFNVYGAQKVSLKDCESEAVNSSHKIKALELDVQAAQSAAESAKTMNYPSLLLEGSGAYISNLAELNGIRLGDNWNYSIGPAVRWTVFDGNVRKKNYESHEKTAQAKQQELEYNKKEAILSVRTSYFKLVSSLKNLEMLNQQLALTVSQNEDIKNGIKGGVKTKLDGVLSDTDVLNKKNQIKATQLVVIDNIREVNDLTGGIIKFDFAKFAMEESWAGIFSYDEPQALLADFEKYKTAEFDGKNPSVMSLELLSQYYELISQSIINSNYPVVNVYAKTSMQYPNGPIIESYNQNEAGGNFSMPLYQFGKNKKESQSKKYTSMSYEEQKRYLTQQLQRLFEYSRNKTRILEQQRGYSFNIVAQTKDAAALMYKSYIAGESKYLDVENMNVRVIETQTNEVNIYADLLIQLAVMASLAK